MPEASNNATTPDDTELLCICAEFHRLHAAAVGLPREATERWAHAPLHSFYRLNPLTHREILANAIGPQVGRPETRERPGQPDPEQETDSMP
jgi:hypothetical protein